jgi:MOSC domain-containing protein YiiM
MPHEAPATDAATLPLAVETPVEVVELLVSPVHRYEGRPADGPLPAGEATELRDAIEVRAHLGVRGDRYFGRSAHRTAAVTFQAIEALEALATELGAPPPGLAETRRNVLLRGVDVDALTGRRFSLDAGDGAISFQGHRPARPCGWMNVVIADGAHRAMRGRGGIRAEPLGDGTLRLGEAVLRVE